MPPHGHRATPITENSNSTNYQTPQLELESEDDNTMYLDLKEVNLWTANDTNTTILPWIVPLRPQHTPQEIPSSKNKNVKFADLHIRQYNQVFGDHPCCTMGPPVTLGWEYETQKNVSLDYYELTRPQRRTRRQLRLSWEERRAILSKYSDGDCRRVSRRLNREQQCREGSKTNGFFVTQPIAVRDYMAE